MFDSSISIDFRLIEKIYPYIDTLKTIQVFIDSQPSKSAFLDTINIFKSNSIKYNY